MRARPLRRSDLDDDPLRQFETWLAAARDAEIELAEAMAVATAAAGGAPSVRMVLLRGADERGLVFNTNYESRKGSELAENPQAALLFYWHALGRQVRVEGGVEKVDPSETDAYFALRPRASRLSAWASSQSEVIESRAALEAQFEAAAARFGDDVPRPRYWGGYRVAPESWEFWQHRGDRLHDRFRYRRANGRWLVERLAP